MFKDSIFREYDIRGVYQTDFDNTFVYQLGRAYGLLLKEHKQKKPVVSVGHDARLSSPDITEALIDGLVSCGIKILYLGLINTPMSYFSLFYLNIPNGIMVTGSHNPPEYNGFKISMEKSTIFGNQIQKIKAFLKSEALPETTKSGENPLYRVKKFNDFKFKEKKDLIENYDISQDYIDRYKKEFKTLKDPGVILDCGNGAAGVIARRLYNSVGLQPEILFEDPDGRFPNHHPDPTVEKNTTDLKKTVVLKKASIGIGFDGDADRIGVVDEKGRFICGDEIMIVFARNILKNHPGSKIIGDVKCSDRFYRDIHEKGGEAIMWKTGHSLIKNKIKLEKAPFGGELSGHIFFADRNYGYDDALYASLRLIEILGQSEKTINQLLEGIPKSFNTPEIRLEIREEKKKILVKKLQEHFIKNPTSYEVNTLDGIRLRFSGGWALVRSSNTQPVITLRFESDTEEKLHQIKNTIINLIDSLL